MIRIYKCILTSVLILLLLTNVNKEVAYAGSLTDINTGQSFYSEINYLIDKEVISGYNDGTFRPTEEVTRAAAAAMIGRAIGLDGTQQKSSFKDVAESSFASGYIENAVEEEIIKGFTDGTFRPNQKVTRGQMAIFIARAFDLKERQEVVFSDVSSSMAAYDSIQLILADGITQGYMDWTFRPDKKLTRAEFSAFLARALNPEYKVEVLEQDPQVKIDQLVNKQITNLKLTAPDGLSFDDARTYSITGNKVPEIVVTYSEFLEQAVVQVYSYSYDQDKWLKKLEITESWNDFRFSFMGSDSFLSPNREEVVVGYNSGSGGFLTFYVIGSKNQKDIDVLLEVDDVYQGTVEAVNKSINVYKGAGLINSYRWNNGRFE
ncbi:MAG: S-layer homology domain-containing protein [Bacillota bacterium]